MRKIGQWRQSRRDVHKKVNNLNDRNCILLHDYFQRLAPASDLS